MVYLSMVKRPVKVATVAVYVVCGLGGAIGGMLAYTAVFTEGGETDSTLVVLAGFAIALVCSVLAGAAGGDCLWQSCCRNTKSGHPGDGDSK